MAVTDPALAGVADAGLISTEGGVMLTHTTLSTVEAVGPLVGAEQITGRASVFDPTSAPACSASEVTLTDSYVTDDSCDGAADGPSLGLFVDRDAGDFTPATDSPLIDSAPCSDVVVDVNRDPRPVGEACDIGAIEAQLDDSEPPAPPAEPPLRNARLYGTTPGPGRDFVLELKPGAPAPPRISVNGDYVPLGGTNVNFDGTGATDILFYAPGPAQDYLWTFDDDTKLTSTPLRIDGRYQPVLGDFDGNGYTDVFWYAPGPAPDHVWFFEPGGRHESVRVDVRGSYDLRGDPAIDVNGDGRSDLVFHSPDGGPDYVWTGNADRTFTSRPVSLGAGQLLLGDYDGNGTTDAWVYRPGTAPDPLRRGQSDGTFGPAVNRSTNGSYRMVGGPGTDFDGDGTDDLLAYGPGTAPDYFLFGNSTGAPFTDLQTTINGTYTVVTDGDWSAGGDAGTDLVFVGSGADYLWTEIDRSGFHTDNRLPQLPPVRDLITATS